MPSREALGTNRKRPTLRIPFPDERRLAGGAEERRPLVHFHVDLTIPVADGRGAQLHSPEPGLGKEPKLFTKGAPNTVETPVGFRNMVGMSDHEADDVPARALGMRIRMPHVEMVHADDLVPHLEEVVDEPFDSAVRGLRDAHLTCRNIPRGHGALFQLLVPAPDEKRNRFRVGDEEGKDDVRNTNVKRYHGKPPWALNAERAMRPAGVGKIKLLL